MLEKDENSFGVGETDFLANLHCVVLWTTMLFAY